MKEGSIERGYMPFGEFMPDLRYLANDRGLVEARNVVPVYGDYLTAPATSAIASLGLGAGESVTGLMVASANTHGYVATVAPGGGDLREITEGGAVTNRTRTAAADYGNQVLLTGGCSFGANVIACLYNEALPGASEPVQYLASGAARFADMITSTFAPFAKFAFSFRGNLFLAHCFLGGAYDTLAAGLNDTLVAWSQTENIRAFGSFNVDPQLTGTGYQPLNFDIGAITGGVASDEFAIVACADGLVRVDGPPYTFRVAARHHGLAPSALNGICVVGSDVYYIGPSGLMRLANGATVPERIGLGKFSRWLIDDATGFSSAPYVTTPLSLRYDSLTDLLFFRYVSTATQHCMLVYNVGEDRATYWLLADNSSLPQYLDITRIASTGSWCPGRDMRFVRGGTHYGKFSLGNSGLDAVLQKGYVQFRSDNSTRLRRIRPVYSVTDQAAIEQVSVTIESTNKPYKTATSFGPYSTLDGHGWVTTPGTKFADFHSPKFTLASNANMHKVVEYQGFEYEIEIGPEYAA